jgi:hypothetical protein
MSAVVPSAASPRAAPEPPEPWELLEPALPRPLAHSLPLQPLAQSPAPSPQAPQPQPRSALKPASLPVAQLLAEPLPQAQPPRAALHVSPKKPSASHSAEEQPPRVDAQSPDPPAACWQSPASLEPQSAPPVAVAASLAWALAQLEPQLLPVHSPEPLAALVQPQSEPLADVPSPPDAEVHCALVPPPACAPGSNASRRLAWKCGRGQSSALCPPPSPLPTHHCAGHSDSCAPSQPHRPRSSWSAS